MTKNTQSTDHYYRSLNRNIILIIIVVSVIPLIIVSSTIYFQFRASYHAKVNDHLRELVQSHAKNIDQFLQEKLSDIRVLSDSWGRDKLEDESILKERLATLQKGFGRDFVDLGVINAAGEQIAYAGPFKLTKADYSDAEWFHKAIQSEFYISDVFLGLKVCRTLSLPCAIAGKMAIGYCGPRSTLSDLPPWLIISVSAKPALHLS